VSYRLADKSKKWPSRTVRAQWSSLPSRLKGHDERKALHETYDEVSSFVRVKLSKSGISQKRDDNENEIDVIHYGARPVSYNGC